MWECFPLIHCGDHVRLSLTFVDTLCVCCQLDMLYTSFGDRASNNEAVVAEIKACAEQLMGMIAAKDVEVSEWLIMNTQCTDRLVACACQTAYGDEHTTLCLPNRSPGC
jgi:hypothetical protein